MEIVEALIRSMLRHCTAVIEVQGEWIKYWGKQHAFERVLN